MAQKIPKQTKRHHYKKARALVPTSPRPGPPLCSACAPACGAASGPASCCQKAAPLRLDLGTLPRPCQPSADRADEALRELLGQPGVSWKKTTETDATCVRVHTRSKILDVDIHRHDPRSTSNPARSSQSVAPLSTQGYKRTNPGTVLVLRAQP